MTLEPKG